MVEDFSTQFSPLYPYMSFYHCLLNTLYVICTCILYCAWLSTETLSVSLDYVDTILYRKIFLEEDDFEICISLDSNIINKIALNPF